jgi:hypothetical protein
MGNSGFESSKQMRNVALNEGLEHVGDRAFAGCTMLKLVGVPLSVGYMDESCGGWEV